MPAVTMKYSIDQEIKLIVIFSIMNLFKARRSFIKRKIWTKTSKAVTDAQDEQGHLPPSRPYPQDVMRASQRKRCTGLPLSIFYYLHSLVLNNKKKTWNTFKKWFLNCWQGETISPEPDSDQCWDKNSDINHNNGHLMPFNSQSAIYSNSDHHSAITAASCDSILV